MDNHNQDFNKGFTEYKAEIAANGQRDFRSECMELNPLSHVPSWCVLKHKEQLRLQMCRQTLIVTQLITWTDEELCPSS